MLQAECLERAVPLPVFPANGFRLVDRADGRGVSRGPGGRNLKRPDSHPGGQFGGLSQQPQRGVGVGPAAVGALVPLLRSEEHTSELQSLMRISYAVFCLKKKIYHSNK